MTILEPITDFKIIVTELSLWEAGCSHVFQITTLKNVTELREYFINPSKYQVAISLGYTKVVKPAPEKYSTGLKGRLSMIYSDRMINNRTLEFDDVHKFVNFLKQHPPLGKIAGL